MLYETEAMPVDPPEDEIWILNDSGELVKMEVSDDVGDD